MVLNLGNVKGMDSKKAANDKLHASDLGEEKDFNELAFDGEQNSFEFDVKGDDLAYDHPLPYDTTAANGEDSISTYDEANPYDGKEYEASDALADDRMRVVKKKDLKTDIEDKLLSRTEEDFRDDLDAEGYPVNDKPKP